MNRELREMVCEVACVMFGTAGIMAGIVGVLVIMGGHW